MAITIVFNVPGQKQNKKPNSEDLKKKIHCHSGLQSHRKINVKCKIVTTVMKICSTRTVYTKWKATKLRVEGMRELRQLRKHFR